MSQSHWKIVFALVVGLGAGYLLNVRTDATAQSNEEGRYRLVPAQFVMKYQGANRAEVEPGLFRIDVESGRTWRFSEVVLDDGRHRRNWALINEER